MGDGVREEYVEGGGEEEHNVTDEVESRLVIFCSYSDPRQSSLRRFIQDERATVQEIIFVSHMTHSV